MSYQGLQAQEFADLCGVSKDTLLYYDKIGLFHPAYVAENGYRRYSLDQVHTFDLLLMLRDSHVPLKEMKQYLENRNPEEMLGLLREQNRHLQRELSRLQKLCQRLETTASQVEKGIADQDKGPEIQIREEESYVTVPARPEFVNDKKNKMAAIREFLRLCQNEELPGDYLRCSIVSKERLMEGCFEKEFYGVHLTGPVSWESPEISRMTRPKGRYAVIRHHGDHESLGSSYEKLTAYIRKNGWRICGNAYETELIGYICVMQDADYVIEIAIEVERA